MTVEKVTEIDEKYLDLNIRDYNCVAVVSSQTYNSDGVMSVSYTHLTLPTKA